MCSHRHATSVDEVFQWHAVTPGQVVFEQGLSTSFGATGACPPIIVAFDVQDQGDENFCR